MVGGRALTMAGYVDKLVGHAGFAPELLLFGGTALVTF